MTHQYELPIYKPYTYRVVRDGWFSNDFIIEFEGVDVFTYEGSYKDVVRFVDHMNTAWTLGHGSGWLAREFQQPEPTKKISIAGTLDKLVPVNGATAPFLYASLPAFPLDTSVIGKYEQRNGKWVFTHHDREGMGETQEEAYIDWRAKSPYSQPPAQFNQELFNEWLKRLSQPWHSSDGEDNT